MAVPRFGYASPLSAASAHDRALLAAGDRLQREMARGKLATIGIALDTATGCRETLDRLRSQTYAIALIDLEMPCVDGFDLVQRIGCDARHAGMPIIVITGRVDFACIDRAFALGAHACVKKPINWTVLRFQVQDLIHAASHDPLRRKPAFTKP
jgi:CheY-like chemotaxis protein